MILQVNKVKKELDVSKFLNSEGFVTNECIKHNEPYIESELSLEEYLEDKIESKSELVFGINEFGRGRGKTTLINKLANKYNLPIIVPSKHMRTFYDSKRVFSIEEEKGRIKGWSMPVVVLVDEISYDDYCRLRNYRIIPIGFIKDEKHEVKKVYEDYIEISSVIKLSDSIKANAKQYDIHLSYNKEFYNDSYGVDNQDFYIDSVYLLDDTGKTIKKLM